MGKQKEKGWNKKPCPRCHGTGKMQNNGKNRKRARNISAEIQFIGCDLCGGSGKKRGKI